MLLHSTTSHLLMAGKLSDAKYFFSVFAIHGNTMVNNVAGNIIHNYPGASSPLLCAFFKAEAGTLREEHDKPARLRAHQPIAPHEHQ